MGEITRIKEYFSEVETTKEHNGYFCSVGEALTVVILGTLCGLKNVSQISQWSEEENLSCIGTINRRFTYKGNTSDEWHYYISSRKLTAEGLLKHARSEWSVESMHWLLDCLLDCRKLIPVLLSCEN